ncbi:hypothetical protein QP162_20835 [Sphingomonas aurantiaca]|uniref:hypothetical protein n=1 Tax=Sphingomonas aurantiaca TaxID=185949 RepID=UPI002FE26902
MTLARRYDATSYARNFLEQRLVQLRSRINDSERQLVDYASRQGIVNLPASTTEGERSIVAEDLANTNRRTRACRGRSCSCAKPSQQWRCGR